VRRISAGIYRDKYGIRAIVDVAAGRKEKRFHASTPLADIKHWRNTTKGELEAQARRRPSKAGTLRVDVPRYLAQIKGQVSAQSWKSRRSELDGWLELFGDRPRGTLTPADIRGAIARWRAIDPDRKLGRGNPCSVRTCEHRVATLRHLFHVLDGDDTITPCDGFTFELPPTRPVLVSPNVIRDVLHKLTTTYPDSAARFAVLASTGVRPAELMRAEPADVNLRERYWIVRTAKGGRRPPMWLNDDMLNAWRYFVKVAAWGPYDTSTHAKRLYAAGWPEGVRPYNTRASFGMELSRRGADLHDVQQLLGHTDAKTTRAYYVPPENSRLVAATRNVDRRFGWTFRNGALNRAKRR
jgi:integrase